MANEDSNKQQAKSKYALATERQWEKCKCGWNCWRLQGKKCCPGCVGVGGEHYREHEVKEGVWISKGKQGCGCTA